MKCEPSWIVIGILLFITIQLLITGFIAVVSTIPGIVACFAVPNNFLYPGDSSLWIDFNLTNGLIKDQNFLCSLDGNLKIISSAFLNKKYCTKDCIQFLNDINLNVSKSGTPETILLTECFPEELLRNKVFVSAEVREDDCSAKSPLCTLGYHRNDLAMKILIGFFIIDSIFYILISIIVWLALGTKFVIEYYSTIKKELGYVFRNETPKE